MSTLASYMLYLQSCLTDHWSYLVLGQQQGFSDVWIANICWTHQRQYERLRTVRVYNVASYHSIYKSGFVTHYRARDVAEGLAVSFSGYAGVKTCFVCIARTPCCVVLLLCRLVTSPQQYYIHQYQAGFLCQILSRVQYTQPGESDFHSFALVLNYLHPPALPLLPLNVQFMSQFTLILQHRHSK